MRIPALALLSTCLMGQASAQGFVTPDGFGWSRGDANTSFYSWDDFTTATGPNAPDAGAFPAQLPGSWVSPSVTETTGTAFVTSTGNIYSFTTQLAFEVVVPAEPIEGGTTTVLLQTRTQGREVDHATLFCNGQPPVEYVEHYRFTLGPKDVLGGDLVDALWRFEVPATGTATITFDGTDLSMSLDRLEVDTFSTEGTACLADVNGDGSVTPADFSAWVAAFNTQSAGCDQNGDGACSPADFSAWVSNFNAGC